MSIDYNLFTAKDNYESWQYIDLNKILAYIDREVTNFCILNNLTDKQKFKKDIKVIYMHFLLDFLLKYKISGVFIGYNLSESIPIKQIIKLLPGVLLQTRKPFEEWIPLITVQDRSYIRKKLNTFGKKQFNVTVKYAEIEGLTKISKTLKLPNLSYLYSSPKYHQWNPA